MIDASRVEALRRAFREAAPPHVTLPEAITENDAAALRKRVAPDLQPFYVPDRGRYHVNRTFADTPLFDALRALAQNVVAAPLSVGAARWLRFIHGDYQLMRGDVVDRPERTRHIEVTLDFSAAATDQAELAFVGERAKFTVPQMPRSLTLVERDESLLSFDYYLNNHVGAAEVWRLRLALPYTSAPA